MHGKFRVCLWRWIWASLCSFSGFPIFGNVTILPRRPLLWVVIQNMGHTRLVAGENVLRGTQCLGLKEHWNIWWETYSLHNSPLNLLIIPKNISIFLYHPLTLANLPFEQRRQDSDSAHPVFEAVSLCLCLSCVCMLKPNHNRYHLLNAHSVPGTLQGTLLTYSYFSFLPAQSSIITPLTDEETGSVRWNALSRVAHQSMRVESWFGTFPGKADAHLTRLTILIYTIPVLTPTPAPSQLPPCFCFWLLYNSLEA